MIAGRSGCRLLALAVLLASGFVGAAAPAPDADPLTGKLLVASPDIGDPRFRHAVILLVRHGEGGAFGIIVNHPIGAWSWERLMAAVGRNGAGLAGTVRVFAGGPVEPTSGFVLHSPDYRRDATMAIDGSVAMTSSVGILRDIAGHAGPQKCLVAFGYAGWGPGQLDRELALHAWFAIADDPKLVFDDDRAKIWDEAMARRTIAL